MITLNVDLGRRSYPIFIGSGILGTSGLLTPYINGRDCLILSSETVAPIYLEPLRAMLGTSRTEVMILPDGETSKNFTCLESILDLMVEKKYSRDGIVITLGGGVIGDIGGFAAAIYQRGVDFIQVPTTLLAQVDSSVGGKTGINHPGGKNLVGAFHQPRCVLSDTDTLRTLPDRELSAGLAEVVKYGLIADADFFSWLEEQANGLLKREPAALDYAIKRSCEIKAGVVVEDETEQGIRAILNFGHTFGHAIERCMGYGEWLHGEAVAAGMCMAARFSEQLGWSSTDDSQRVRHLLTRLNLPCQPPPLNPGDFMAAMSMDKKVIGGEIRLVLMAGIGNVKVTADYPSHELLDMLSGQFIR